MTRQRKPLSLLSRLEHCLRPLVEGPIAPHVAVCVALLLASFWLWFFQGVFETPTSFRLAHASFCAGNFEFRRGKIATAIEFYWESLRWVPEYEGAWQALGNAIREQAYHPFSENQLGEAVQSHMTAAEYTPLQGRARYNLAVDLHVDGDYSNAIDYYKAALVANSFMPDAWYGLARAYQDVNNYASALRSLSRTLKVMPMHREARLAYCRTLYSLGNIPGCIHCVRELVSLHPKSARALVSAAIIYQDLGQYEAAKLLYRTALDIAPGHLVAGTRYAAMVGMRNFILGSEYLLDYFSSYAVPDDHVALSTHHRMYHLLYETIRNHVDGQGIRLLDIGCGTGLLCAMFRDYVSEMAGVDLSMPMALTARARGCYNFIIAEDARSLRHIYPQQFDVAVMTDVIPFISNITMTSIFEAVHELVRDGGLVAFTVEAAETMALVEQALQASEQDRAEMLKDKSEDEFCWEGWEHAQQSSAGDTPSSRKRGKPRQQLSEPQLQITARYAHSLEYLTNLLTGLPFEVLETRRAVVRIENGVPVCGYVVVAKTIPSD